MLEEKIDMIIIGMPSISYTEYILISHIVDPSKIKVIQKKESPFSDPYVITGLQNLIPQITLDNFLEKPYLTAENIKPYTGSGINKNESLNKYKDKRNEYFRKYNKSQKYRMNIIKKGSRS